MISHHDVEFKDIFLITDLWEANRKYHEEKSEYFGFQYKNMIFDDRMKYFEKFDKDDILITIIRNDEECIGYCISIVENNNGELCSMYIKKQYRGIGLGKIVAEKHVGWMKARKCKKIKVIVSQENYDAIEFYKSIGFKINTIIMEI